MELRQEGGGGECRVVAIDMLMPNTNTHVKCPINCNGKYSHSMTLTMALALALTLARAKLSALYGSLQRHTHTRAHTCSREQVSL